ncbi:biotin synthase BioB [Propionispora hippei]|uniref:Biotin synthase n=1 Tax=Propionispora hippei DSM 15287 TaxID=1123003 RepID=A0A1M6G4I8_9FIRM|nr:biotin synthase BioB [Propionispora hippei]SHJ04814.1 biotin synthase [Propionispora hippei DSM 15287]
MLDLIKDLAEKVLDGATLTGSEALQLTDAEGSDILLLAAYANKIREHYKGPAVDMCGIINARSGTCSEDCKFCAQSAYHQTDAPVYPLLSFDELLKKAQEAQRSGATRISLVTSGRGMEGDPDFERILEIIRGITTVTGLAVCANLGTISGPQARRLAAAGVRRYAHNLETSRQFYSEICTTHSYQDRLATVQAARNAGLELCTGGIIGLGESWEDRISLALTLRELQVASVPINILNPIKGTALEKTAPLPALAIIKAFAMFRFLLPDRIIRPAGGREINLRDMQGLLMLAGANGLIIGNYLTFKGRQAADDFTMIHDAGLLPADYTKEIL